MDKVSVAGMGLPWDEMMSGMIMISLASTSLSFFQLCSGLCTDPTWFLSDAKSAEESPGVRIQVFKFMFLSEQRAWCINKFSVIFLFGCWASSSVHIDRDCQKMKKGCAAALKSGCSSCEQAVTNNESI